MAQTFNTAHPGVNARVDQSVFDLKVGKTLQMIDAPNSPSAQKLKTLFTQHIKARYDQILKAEMPRSKELDTLNKGFVVRQGGETFALPVGRGIAEVGTGEGGRFIQAAWTPIAQAVSSQRARLDTTAPKGIIRVAAVNADVVRKLTRMRWQMRDARGRFRGGGVSEPFGHQWLQVLEAGGQVTVPNFGKVRQNPKVQVGAFLHRRGTQWEWIVIPRIPGRRLHPQPGVYVHKMRKTVQPIGMFRRALYAGTAPLMKAWMRDFNHQLVVIGFRSGRASPTTP